MNLTFNFFNIQELIETCEWTLFQFVEMQYFLPINITGEN